MKPNRNQGTGKIPTDKPKKGKGYSWGASKGHSISLKQHKANVKKRGSSGSGGSAYNPLDDPNAVTRPQTLRDIYRNANTATNLRYGQQEQALNLTTRQTPAWFEQYKAQVAGGPQSTQGRTDTMYGGAVAQVNQRATDTQTANDTARAQLYAQAVADAKSRGATVDPNLFLADANAATVRRQGSNDFANLLTSQGAATHDYYGGIQTAAGAAQIAQQQQNADLLRGLQGEKGQYRSQYVTDARDAAHKSLLEDKAFGLDTYKAQTAADLGAARIKGTAKNARAQRRATSRADRNSVITSGALTGKTKGWVRKHPNEAAALTKTYNAKTQKPGKKPITGPGSLSTDAENKVVTSASSLFGLLSHPPKWPGGPLKGKVMTPDQVLNHYASSGTDPRIVALAKSLHANGGKLDAAGIKAAHALGIHVGGRWGTARKPKRKKQYTPGSDTPLA